ncbi:hypothetical protein EVAR_30986_1 [Eumeta japonica]|uniref:Uncharacterized protein n=1 Tax=Eumeta variegata TaxID=151549 RepID=A0A4C1W9Z8_EUMVA|nr:hypothetical protein EVAR_30986_1 [Eumeta japonica]
MPSWVHVFFGQHAAAREPPPTLLPSGRRRLKLDASPQDYTFTTTRLSPPSSLRRFSCPHRPSPMRPSMPPAVAKLEVHDASPGRGANSQHARYHCPLQPSTTLVAAPPVPGAPTPTIAVDEPETLGAFALHLVHMHRCACIPGWAPLRPAKPNATTSYEPVRFLS